MATAYMPIASTLIVAGPAQSIENAAAAANSPATTSTAATTAPAAAAALSPVTFTEWLSSSSIVSAVPNFVLLAGALLALAMIGGRR
ncbi:MAG TPA: hypothetical protein VG345_16665 [Bryobacteraceae bacterium]|jgi:hypothetical protein|nr:hypothetical protein [Bryobacteraceae bacterium]